MQFETFVGEDGRWYWRLVIPSKGILHIPQIIAGGEQGHPSEQACIDEIVQVKACAAAPVVRGTRRDTPLIPLITRPRLGS